MNMPHNLTDGTIQSVDPPRDLSADEQQELRSAVSALRRARAGREAARRFGLGSRENPIHQWYVELDGPGVRIFLDQALQAAVEMLGEPVIPVRQVHLHLSQTIRSAPEDLKQGFQLTDLVDAERGEFCIYLRWRPGQTWFFGQLAHEVPHLLNASLYDCYVEGLSTVFSERCLKQCGRESDWQVWERHFRSGQDAFHGQTYFMMSQIMPLVSGDALRAFLKYAVARAQDAPNVGGELLQQIDFNRWLDAEVDSARRPDVERIVQDFAETILPVRPNDPSGAAFGFELPRVGTAAT